MHGTFMNSSADTSNPEPTLSISTVVDGRSLKGVMGGVVESLLSSTASTSPSNGNINATQHLEKRTKELISQVNSLKQIESALTREAEQYRLQIKNAEDATRNIEKWSTSEISLLTERINTLVDEKTALENALTAAKEEHEKANKQYQHTLTRYSSFEDKLKTRQQRIATLESEVAQLKSQAIDPALVASQQEKISELMGN
jgi:chromosome segregation ATPase